MSVDVKQGEWIWEFFLKNCKDARMIQELMNALPFPEENLHLKRMFLLRSLSLQVSAGMIDELTLDMLMGLGYLGGVSAVTMNERLGENVSSQDGAKRRKVSKNESNDDEPTNSFISQVKGGSVPSRNLEQGREFSEDAVSAGMLVGIRDLRNGRPMSAQEAVRIRDLMKVRPLPKSLGGGGDPLLENLSKGNKEIRHDEHAGTPDGAKDLPGNHLFSPDQSRKHCDLELAVMLELAVKHLRGESRDRKSFESAVRKYWGDPSDDSEGWHGARVPGITRVRDQIKLELSMVRKNPELLDGVVQKYTKARVEDLFKIYLENAWAATGQTFLERVSTDVKNGKYKPVNCSGQRSKKVESPPGDGDAGQQSSGKADTSEKPWIRASRGRYSQSREKFQKNFAIWDLDDGSEMGGATTKLPNNHRAGDGEETRTGDAGSSQPDRGRGDEHGVNLENKMLEGGDVRPSLSTDEGLEINARSLRFEGSVARVLEFEYPCGRESDDRQQQCQDTEDTVRADLEVTEAEHVLHETNDIAIVSGGGGDVDVICALDLAKPPEDSNVIHLSEEETDDQKSMNAKAIGDSEVVDLSEDKEAATTADEKRTKEAGCPKNTDLRVAQPGSPHEVVNKENSVPQSPPKPTDSNPTVCFSPPPWVAVEESPVDPGAEGIAPSVRRKMRHESIKEETDAATRKEGGSSAEAAGPTTCSNQSPDTVSTQRNLRRKQRVLDAVVQDPLPKILTTSRLRGSLLERNRTARTVEWEEDDIENSPSSSPSASRNVRLPHAATERKISPLVGSKTTGVMNATNTRRKPRKWSEKEVEILKREVGKYGKGRWKMILQKNMDSFQGRTEVDLKDKWRNLERFEGIRD